MTCRVTFLLVIYTGSPFRLLTFLLLIDEERALNLHKEPRGPTGTERSAAASFPSPICVVCKVPKSASGLVAIKRIEIYAEYFQHQHSPFRNVPRSFFGVFTHLSVDSLFALSRAHTHTHTRGRERWPRLSKRKHISPGVISTWSLAGSRELRGGFT